MELTRRQNEGLRIAIERYNNNEPYTVISGFAGSGKSTLIAHIVSALGLYPEEVAYIAFTGKASEVLRRKGCPNACTAHKLLYYSSKTVDGKFIFRARKSLDAHYKLIVVDEVSMLSKNLWDLLLTHRIPVIACGDPGQLPPINKDNMNHVLDHPHIFLDEIMRQAQDSEIIRLSMDIREGRPLNYFKGKEVQIIRPEEVVEGMYTWADQILVGTNKKRNDINTCMRNMLNHYGSPKAGDKIISLENHWDILDLKEESALINGTIGYINSCEEKRIIYNIRPNFVIGPISSYKFNITNEIGESYESLFCDKRYIDEGIKSLTPKQEYYIYKNKNRLPSLPIQIDYGYAITVHRAQGSSWGKILVYEERFPFDKEEHKKWLYTACTRAEQRCVLVR